MTNDWKDCIARVYCDGIFIGTAFLVGRGWALTAHHLFFVEGKPRKGKISLADVGAWRGREPLIKKEVIGHPEQKDVALLQFDEPLHDVPYIPLAFNHNLYPKQNVDISGFDSCRDACRDFPLALSATNELGEWITHIYNAPGTSGSPVVLDGCVVGLLHARNTDRNISYIIPVSAFRDFVKQHVPLEAAPAAEFKPIERPFYAPYLINYQKQQDCFRKLIKKHREKTNESRHRILVCLLHGWERSATAHGLAYRLRNDLETYCLPQFESYAHPTQLEEPQPIECGVQTGEALHAAIESSLLNTLSRKIDKKQPFDKPMLFYSEIESVHVSKALLQDFLTFWQQEDWGEQNHLVLVCLFVHYSRTLFDPFPTWHLTRGIKNLLPDDCILPVLSSIPRCEVANWINTQAKQYLAPSRINTLLSRLNELYPNGKPLPMEILAPKLNELFIELAQ